MKSFYELEQLLEYYPRQGSSGVLDTIGRSMFHAFNPASAAMSGYIQDPSMPWVQDPSVPGYFGPQTTPYQNTPNNIPNQAVQKSQKFHLAQKALKQIWAAELQQNPNKAHQEMGEFFKLAGRNTQRMFSGQVGGPMVQGGNIRS